MRCDKILLIGNIANDPECRYRSSRTALIDRLAEIFEPKAKTSCSIRNEANLTGGENVGGTTATPAAPEASGDDDDGGDPDPEPERRSRTRKTRNTSSAGALPATNPARITGALAAFPHLPDSAFVNIKVVCAVTARSPASTWRDVKAGRLPAPHKIGPRSTRWQVGELRAALARLAA